MEEDSWKNNTFLKDGGRGVGGKCNFTLARFAAFVGFARSLSDSGASWTGLAFPSFSFFFEWEGRVRGGL